MRILDEKTVLTVTEAARYLGLAESTLNKWRVYGEGPVFLKLGKAIRYRKVDLDSYLEDHKMASTSQYGRVGQ